MSKFCTLIMLIFLISGFALAQQTVLWEKSAAQGTLPGWFDTGNLTRGLSYGQVGGNDRLYVVSRNGGNFIYILDAASGDSLGRLDNRGFSGGTLVINDVGVSNDGMIFACNLAVGGTFKVYAYTSEVDSPEVVISYDATGVRLGDKLTVKGSAADNTLQIWAASASAPNVSTKPVLVKFSTADNGATFSPTIVDVDVTGATSYGSAHADPLPSGDFYWNAGGQNPKKFAADGTLIGTVPGSVVATGSNAIAFLANRFADDVFATYAFGAGNENAKVVYVPEGTPALAKAYSMTPTLGANPNANGTGDVSVQNKGDGIYVVYVLSTNNGFGAYEINTNYFAGNYYIGAAGTGPDGSDPHFASLKDAFDMLNTDLIADNCTFYITSNIDEPNTGAGLGLALDPSPYVVRFKPYTGVQPVVTLAYPADANEGPSGAFVIGLPDLGTTGHRINWPDIRPTRNIVIDGANTEDGTTRDLTIQCASTAHRNGIPLVIVGDCQDIDVLNTNIYYKPVVTSTSGNLFIGAVMIRARYDYIPKNIWFENNHLSSNFDGIPQNAQGLGFYAASSTLPTGDYPNGITIKNNLIEGKRRGIALYIAGSTDILDNEIILNQNVADGLTSEAILASSVKEGSEINILNNRVSKISAMNSTGTTSGLTGISLETNGTYHIHNNMMTGFELTAANPSAYLYGVKNSSATATMNLLHNTLVMNNLADVGTGVVNYYGLLISNGTNVSKNNILINNEDDFKTYGVYREGANGTLESDYNNLYLSGTVNSYAGFFNGTDAKTPFDWATASGLDLNSKSKLVEFVSDSDLHLSGSSIGDFDLAGTPLAEVTTDIDGNTRSALYPYMGADEAEVELTPPTILTVAEARYDGDGDFRPDLLGDTVTVRGYINSPNYSSGTQYYMQDETAGIQVYGGSSMNLQWNFGDEILITAKVDYYRGSTELSTFTADNVMLISTGNTIVPTKIKIADLGEVIESQLVQVDSVYMVNPSQWPATGSNGNVYITDGTDTTYIFIDKETDLDGWTPPTGPGGLFNVIAVADQYTSSSSVYNDGYSLRGTYRDHFIAVGPPPPPPLPLVETFSDGTADLEWVIHPESAGGTVEIADSTASAWGSHVGVFTDSAYTGLLHVKDALYEDYTISADIYIVGDPDPEFALYSGLGIKIAGEEFKYYRFVFRNSSASDNGQLRLQGYDGANWHISKYWNPGVDFEPLQTGWHNFKITVVGNDFWAYIDGKELPGCPYSEDAPFLTEGYPGMYVYNTALGRIIFDNFMVTEPTFPPPPEPELLVPVWSLTQAAGTFPSYMSTSNYERGMAYGKVNGQDRVYVVTRNGIHRTLIHDAITGDSVGTIPKPAAAEGVGLFHLNCVDVSDDGIIFECNMTLNNDATNPFRVYRWDNETAEPQTVISYDAALGRMGDMFSVFGSASDNSLVIYAGVASKNQMVKFTTTDNGQTFTPNVITLPENSGTVPNAAQVSETTFWMKSFGRKATLFNTSGAVVDTIPGSVLATGASKIAYLENTDGKFVLAYYPDLNGGGGKERVDVVDVTYGGAKAKIVAQTPSIGKTVNGNGTGSLDFYVMNDETILVYVLGTNNGVAAFTNNPEFTLANLDTLFKGDTPVLHPNPFGSGYIVGTNSYGDIGKYQRFDLAANDLLYGFRFYFAFKEILNEPDTLHLVVKTVAENGAPDQLLTSVMTTMDVIDTTGVGNTFFLPAPLKLSGPVFIGFEWSTSTDDEFALFADADGEGDGANRAWERFSDGSYNDFGIILNPDFSWNVDVDLWIAAYYKKAEVVSLENDGAELLPLKYSLSQNYPNPFNPKTKFQLALPKSGEVTIVVYNSIGQKITELFSGNLAAGTHIFEFDGSRFASGIYFYRVQASKFTAVKKMVLVK